MSDIDGLRVDILNRNKNFKRLWTISQLTDLQTLFCSRSFVALVKNVVFCVLTANFVFLAKTHDFGAWLQIAFRKATSIARAAIDLSMIGNESLSMRERPQRTK